MMPDPQIRTTIRNRTRSRRLSACHRHPSEPVTGFCALCLRDRLAGLDSSAAEAEVEKLVGCTRRTRGHAVAASSSAAPALRRSKSVAAEKGENVNGLATDPRRKSCDVRGRSTLSDLFVVDDTKRGGGGVPRVEWRNLGFCSIAEPVLEMKEDEVDDDDDEEEDDDDGDEVRVSDDVFERNEVNDDDDIEEEGDLKTMKEFIDIELQNKRRNFWDAASVFSQKLRKWRQKQKQKKQNRDYNGGTDIDRSKLGQFRDTQSEVADYGLGRRSCDTEPRFSIDAHRLSVEDPRFSFDEHRSSWDGYMIARTIPRLTPMLSIVDTMLPPVNRATSTSTTMENLQMHSISEDGGSSGGSAQSNSDTSTSNRGSSSSSMKSSSTQTTDDLKSASNARVSPANDVIFQGTKLVITENELKDWRLNSIKNNNNNINSVSNTPISSGKPTVNSSKKSIPSKWRKVCNLWSHKKNLEEIPETLAERSNSNNSNSNRNTNSMNSRNFVLDRNRSTRYSTSDIDNGLLRLYLTPFRNNSRRGKSGKSRGRNMSPSIMHSNGFQLN